MAQVNHQVDAQAEENTFDCLPADTYTVVLDSSEWKPTKDAQTEYLSLSWKVIDGKYNGRLIFEVLNLKNKGPKAAETIKIAQTSLSAIGLACGVSVIKDTAQLHGIPISLKVGITAPTEAYPNPKNKILKHLPMNGKAPVQPVSTSAGSEDAPPPAGKKKPSWA